MQHDRAASVHHVCLEEHFIDMAVIVDNVEFGGGKVEAPVAEVLIDNVDGVILKSRIETRTLKDFAQDTDCIDQVCKGAECGEAGEEGRVVVVLEGIWERNLLLSMSA